MGTSESNCTGQHTHVQVCVDDNNTLNCHIFFELIKVHISELLKKVKSKNIREKPNALLVQDHSV